MTRNLEQSVHVPTIQGLKILGTNLPNPNSKRSKILFEKKNRKFFGKVEQNYFYL